MSHAASSEPGTVQVHAQVARVRFETAFVKFAAPAGMDEASLNAQAVEHALSIDETEWLATDVNDGSYQPFTVAALTADEVEATDGDPSPAEVRAACNQFDMRRFLLLQADMDAGEGELVLQPWFVTDPPDLMMADLVSDWISLLKQLGLAEMSERCDELLSGAKVDDHDYRLFGSLSQHARPRPISRGDR